MSYIEETKKLYHDVINKVISALLQDTTVDLGS